MFRFRVRKNPDPLLKFTQKTVLFQDISIFFVLKTELYLSSGTYFFFWKLVFHFTDFLKFFTNTTETSLTLVPVGPVTIKPPTFFNAL